ncbi:MAG TPA: hypothetical protein VHT91_01460 [Kofleriaceae bacterium]|jgi:hypothetical protein|nr:hypothetical protein [Kofleriaceae bacterium]
MPELFEEEHTEVLARAVWMHRRPSQRWLAGAAVWFALAIAITMCAPHSTHTLAPATVAALEHQATELGLTIDAAARAAHQRAQSVANTPMMRAAILTDAATVADVMKSEFRFQLAPGEVIELFQIHDGQIDSLIRMPATAPALPRIAARDVARVEIDGTGLRVIAGAHVDRLKDGEGYDARVAGMFMLASPVGVEPIRQQIAEYADDATLVDPTEGSAPRPALLDASRAFHLVHQASDTPGHTLSLAVATEVAKLTLTVVPRLTGHRAPWLDLARNISFVLGALMGIMFALMLALHHRELRRG